MKYKIECMLCAFKENVESTSKYWAIINVVRTKKWAMSEYDYKVFVCCPKCYTVAFDLSCGGNVGFLRDKFKCKGVPYETINT